MQARDLWRLARPETLPASLVPVAVGTAAAGLTGPLSPLWTADVLLVALLLQIGTNMANELFDYRRGLDRPGAVGIAGVLVSGRMRPRTLGFLTAGVYALAVLLGAALAAARGPVLLLLGLLAAALSLAYSAGPRPVAATPFGEALVFLLMGPLEVGVAEVAAGGRLTAAALWASLPVGLTVAAILLANNTRDLEKDREHGRRTLAILLGRERAARLLEGLLLGAPLLALPMAAGGLLPASSLLALLALPLALRLRKRLFLGNPVPPAGAFHLVSGLLLAAGLALAALL